LSAFRSLIQLTIHVFSQLRPAVTSTVTYCRTTQVRELQRMASDARCDVGDFIEQAQLSVLCN